MIRKKENVRGVTLIVLVITIVVLLILAGVTIAALSGDNGILKRAVEAKEKTQQAQKEEEKILSNTKNILDNSIQFNNVNIIDTNPAGVMPSNVRILENDANKGIVIKDKNDNEWVWIEVPKTTVFSELTIDITNELTELDYEAIKNKLIEYVGVYRKGSANQNSDWADEWYDGCGLTSNEYTALYQKMLKNIYVYGGFWIARYEAGIDGSIDDLSKVRTETSERIEIGISPKAISQKNAIPYNWILCSEAQYLSSEMSPDDSYSSSLMFGIQWDLVCKFLEVKSDLTVVDINSNSSNWGNYRDVKIENIKDGKYAIWSWTSSTLGKWTNIIGEYTKADLSSDNNVLLSTGASERLKKMNIYDLAGNAWEWTLEKSFYNNPCVYRGGSFYDLGINYPVAIRLAYAIDSSYVTLGFRSMLFCNI